jgi:hypothetical protein
MNITVKIIKRLLLVIFILFFVLKLEAKEDSTYTFNIEISGGMVENIKPNLNKINIKSSSRFIYPSFRFLWKPDHKLNIGLSTAFLQINKIDENNKTTEFGTTDLKIRTGAVPIMFLLNMEFWGIQLNGALGTSYTYSQLTAFNETSTSTKWINTYYASVGYNIYFLTDFHFGIEGEIYSFADLKSGVLALKAKFGYDFSVWK